MLVLPARKKFQPSRIKAKGTAGKQNSPNEIETIKSPVRGDRELLSLLTGLR
jgi:hypothetical protein